MHPPEKCSGMGKGVVWVPPTARCYGSWGPLRTPCYHSHLGKRGEGKTLQDAPEQWLSKCESSSSMSVSSGNLMAIEISRCHFTTTAPKILGMSNIHPILIEHTQKTHTMGGASKEFLTKLLMISKEMARAEVCTCFSCGDPGKNLPQWT